MMKKLIKIQISYVILFIPLFLQSQPNNILFNEISTELGHFIAFSLENDSFFMSVKDSNLIVFIDDIFRDDGIKTKLSEELTQAFIYNFENIFNSRLKNYGKEITIISDNITPETEYIISGNYHFNNEDLIFTKFSLSNVNNEKIVSFYDIVYLLDTPSYVVNFDNKVNKNDAYDNFISLNRKNSSVSFNVVENQGDVIKNETSYYSTLVSIDRTKKYMIKGRTYNTVNLYYFYYLPEKKVLLYDDCVSGIKGDFVRDLQLNNLTDNYIVLKIIISKNDLNIEKYISNKYKNTNCSFVKENSCLDFFYNIYNKSDIQTINVIFVDQ